MAVGEHNYEYTVYMENIVRDIAQKIVYCREELEVKWKEVCRQKNTSGYIHRQKELKEMLSVCGIDYSMVKTDEDWIGCINKALSMQEREEVLFDGMHQIYREFPTSSDYMERLVRKLGHPAFQKNSVRLAILKQFILETDYFTKPILKWAKENYDLDGNMTSAEFQKAAADHLGEEIFDLLKPELTVREWIEVFLSKIPVIWLDQVKTAETEGFLSIFEPKGYERDWKFSKKLYWLRDFSEPVFDDTDVSEEVWAFLNIAEANMRSLFKGKTEAEKKPKEQYEQRKKDIKKRKKKAFESDIKRLLILADDLATGRFRNNKDMKFSLYLFAIAFGMSVSAGETDPAFDPVTDIEKNLFHDFYQDSLLKYISEDYRRNASILEKEPSGEGINYKNFVETILLYVLNKKELSAREKITLADKLIKDCLKKAKEKDLSGEEQEQLLITEVYKEFFFGDILKLQEKELILFLVENYMIPVDVELEKLMQIASDQETATYYYKKLIRELKAVYEEVDITLDKMNWVEMRDFPDVCKVDSEFQKILGKMNRFLHIKAAVKNVYEQQKKDYLIKFAEAALAEKHEIVTRMDLIAAYFYKYSLSEQGEGLSFPELYVEFCDELNPLLEQCRYQKISVKNIFDIFVVFSLYRISVWA